MSIDLVNFHLRIGKKSVQKRQPCKKFVPRRGNKGGFSLGRIDDFVGKINLAIARTLNGKSIGPRP